MEVLAMVYLKVYSDIYLKRLRKTTKILSEYPLAWSRFEMRTS